MLNKVLLACLVAILAQSACAASPTDSVKTKKQACKAVQKRVAAESGLSLTGPKGMGWFCDHTDNDGKWFVLGLRSNRKCEGICSNLMGWYAVNKVTGKVHEYNVTEMEVGPEMPEAHPLPNNSLQRP